MFYKTHCKANLYMYHPNTYASVYNYSLTLKLMNDGECSFCEVTVMWMMRDVVREELKLSVTFSESEYDDRFS